MSVVSLVRIIAETSGVSGTNWSLECLNPRAVNSFDKTSPVRWTLRLWNSGSLRLKLTSQIAACGGLHISYAISGRCGWFSWPRRNGQYERWLADEKWLRAHKCRDRLYFTQRFSLSPFRSPNCHQSPVHLNVNSMWNQYNWDEESVCHVVGVVAEAQMFHSTFGKSRKRKMSAVSKQITIPTRE